MDSYYDTVIRQCETLMQEGSFKEAYQQLEEELSMPERSAVSGDKGDRGAVERVDR